MRVLVTGCGGQVGAEAARALAGVAQVAAHDRTSLDLADAGAIRERVREFRPDVIVNAAAYTAVDRAESDEAAAKVVNAVAPGVLAEEARLLGAVLVHFSTDYVYDGAKPAPYVEGDPVNPLGVYGRTKLEGERAIGQAGAAHLILRTSWVYGPHGRNFMLTMLRLAGEREELRVVDDQRGAPTSSLQLGELVRRLVVDAGRDRLRAAAGIYHATAAGETTWCGFAREIFDKNAGIDATFRKPRVVPIATHEYPTPARRPANSVLSNARLAEAFGIRLAHWRDGLQEALVRLAAGRRA